MGAASVFLSNLEAIAALMAAVIRIASWVVEPLPCLALLICDVFLF
jgi:hypothetical protein